MNGSPWSLKTTAAAIARCWQAFFHVPCDARVCAAIRITYATLVLIHLGVLYLDLDLWFTESGVLPLESAQKVASPYSWSLLTMLPGTSQVVHACFWVAVAHAVFLLIGLLPRLNAFGLFLWIASFQVRNDIINDGEDCLMRLMGFFLIWLPSGKCWSANAVVARWWNVGWLRVAKRTASAAQPWSAGDAHSHPSACFAPGWPLRLLQIEMAAMFFSSALMKLAGEAWLDGTALYYVSRLDDFFGRFPVPAWLFDSPWSVALITWSVVTVEISIPILIWFRETRRLCLVLLLAFHLCNEWTMNLFLFHWLMLCGWMAFVTPEDVSLLINPWRKKARVNADETDSTPGGSHEVGEAPRAALTGG
jgi:hypothetical protein